MTPFNTFNCIYLQGGIMHELARKVTLMRVGIDCRRTCSD